MKKQVKIFCSIGVLILVLGGAYLLYTSLSSEYEAQDSSASQEEKSYKKAPDFTVYTENGETVRLSSFEGKPVVVNFWASWCAPCQEEMPIFQAAYEKYKDEVQFMMVNLCGYGNDSPENAANLIKTKGFTFPVFYDNDASAMQTYVGRGIPVSAFVTKEGDLAALYMGCLQEKQMEQSLAEILK